jgi:HEAT repeat protein
MAMRSLPGVLVAGVLTMSAAVASAGLAMAAGNDSTDLRTFITQTYGHGVPYHDARAYGPQAVPELLSMLGDSSLEPHWSKVVFTLGAIGDPSAVQPLQSFLKHQRGEVSRNAFQAMLAVPPALGCIANGGDPAAFDTLLRLAKLGNAKGVVKGSYRRYRGTAMKEVIGRMAIQGLGITGTAEASRVLEGMRTDRRLRNDWRDNVDEASALATRVQREGLDRILGGAHD